MTLYQNNFNMTLSQNNNIWLILCIENMRDLYYYITATGWLILILGCARISTGFNPRR